MVDRELVRKQLKDNFDELEQTVGFEPRHALFIKAGTIIWRMEDEDPDCFLELAAGVKAKEQRP